ncbi:MAG: hypothetical protein ACKO14_15335 [Armatimonadota bacterium]
MARNLSGLPFPNRMSAAQYLALRRSIHRVLIGYQFVECREGNGVQSADFLVAVDRQGDATAIFGNPETGQVIVIGDEDHLRISTISVGLNLDTMLAQSHVLEHHLSENFRFSYDADRFGYLTASMANAGLAMRVSVWMHLPGLTLTGRWADVEPLLHSLDISVRGILGEESDMTAGMVQLSNRTSYGRTPEELLAKLTRVIELVDSEERISQSDLLRLYRTQTLEFLRWMSLLEQPFMPKDSLVHAVSAALLASRLGYNVRLDTTQALRVLIAGFKSLQPDGMVQMQVVRNILKDTVMES